MKYLHDGRHKCPELLPGSTKILHLPRAWRSREASFRVEQFVRLCQNRSIESTLVDCQPRAVAARWGRSWKPPLEVQSVATLNHFGSKHTIVGVHTEVLAVSTMDVGSWT